MLNLISMTVMVSKSIIICFFTNSNIILSALTSSFARIYAIFEIPPENLIMNEFQVFKDANSLISSQSVKQIPSEFECFNSRSFKQEKLIRLNLFDSNYTNETKKYLKFLY